VIPAARRFEDHGAASSGRELPELEQVTVTARRAAPVEDPEEGQSAVEQLTMRRLRAAE
jgi:hypothetical protein